MKGFVRTMLGLLLVMGSMGSLEVDPNASVIAMTALAIAGLGIMASGVSAMKEF